MGRNWFRFLAVTLVMILTFGLIVGIVGCKQKPKKKDKVSVRMLWQNSPDAMYLYVGKKKGFYADEGISITLKSPSKPTDPLVTVDTERDDFGVAYPEDILISRDKGSNIKSIGTIYQVNGGGIASISDDIKEPKDFEGKTVGLVSLAICQNRWKSMLKAADVNPDSVKTVDTNFAPVPLLVSGKIDAAATLAWVENIILESQGKKVNMIWFSDYGSPPSYGHCLIANKKMLKDDPDLVERFLKATYKSIQYVIDNPEESAKIFSKEVPASDKKANKITAKDLKKYFQSKRTKEKGLGWQDASNWKRTRDWMLEYQMIKKKVDVDDLFTNDYLP